MILSCLCYLGKYSTDSQVAKAWGKAKELVQNLTGEKEGPSAPQHPGCPQQEYEPGRGYHGP